MPSLRFISAIADNPPESTLSSRGDGGENHAGGDPPIPIKAPVVKGDVASKEPPSWDDVDDIFSSLSSAARSLGSVYPVVHPAKKVLEDLGVASSGTDRGGTGLSDVSTTNGILEGSYISPYSFM